jgi:hypothetical protein
LRLTLTLRCLLYSRHTRVALVLSGLVRRMVRQRGHTGAPPRFLGTLSSLNHSWHFEQKPSPLR